jgi:hypothetical protein
MKGKDKHGSFPHKWCCEAPACADHEEAYDPAEDGGLRLVGCGRVRIHCEIRQLL